MKSPNAQFSPKWRNKPAKKKISPTVTVKAIYRRPESECVPWTFFCTPRKINSTEIGARKINENKISIRLYAIFH